MQQKNKEKLEVITEKDQIIKSKLNIAIALANQEQIVESHEIFQEIDDITSKKYFHKTIQPYREKLKANPNNIMYLNYVAFSDIIAEEYQSSINYLKRIIELDKDNVAILNFLAASYIQVDNIEKAQYYIKKAKKIKESEFSSFLLGYIYYKQGNYFKSITQFTKSGKLFKHYVID